MNESILIVDDDEEISDEMKEILSDENYDVSQCFNGTEAEKLLAANHYDLILMDIKMPGLSGFEVIKRIRDASVRSRILIVSGRPFIRHFLPGEESEREEKSSVMLELADGLINKPFDVESLLSEIRKLLSRKPDADFTRR